MKKFQEEEIKKIETFRLGVIREFPYTGGVDPKALKLYNDEVQRRVDELYNAFWQSHVSDLESSVNALFNRAVGESKILENYGKIPLDSRPLPEDLKLMTGYLDQKGYIAVLRSESRDGGFSMTTRSECAISDYFLYLTKKKDK